MHPSLCAPHSPIAGICLLVTVERFPAFCELLLRHEVWLDFREVFLLGNSPAEEPLAMNASVRRITGVMCSMAMRAASNAIVKQSVGLAAATTQSGLSPLRP